MATNLPRFVIRRKDVVDSSELIIETDGLAIGSILENNLILNHPTVSRLHAGIKQLDFGFWITNLSKSNGTLVNGSLIDTVKLEVGDIIQVGVFLIKVSILAENSNELVLEIECQIDFYAAGNRATQLLEAFPQSSENYKTVILDSNLLSMIKKAKHTKQLDSQPESDLSTSRLKRNESGLLSSVFLLPENERKRFQETLDAFWERRKQSQQQGQDFTPKSNLCPTELDPELIKHNLHLGKKRFNWVSTSDLIPPWPKGYLYTFGIVILLLAVTTVFAWKEVYSPGAISNPHALPIANLSSEITERLNFRLVAKNVVENNCAACHSLNNSMQAHCTQCHQTSHFNSSVTSPHEKAKIACIDCHTEHKGREFRPSLVARSMCIDCHKDNPTHPKARKVDGSLLKTPHGGTLGYPVVNGKWVFGTELQSENSSISPKEKFHLVHASSTEQQWQCSGCHISFATPESIKQIDKNKCAICHAVNYEISNTQLDQLAVGLGLDCSSCHSQHGKDSFTLASFRAQKLNSSTSNYTIDSVYRGGKAWQWISFASRFGGMSVKQWGLFFSLIPISITGFLIFDNTYRRRIQSLVTGKLIDISLKKRNFSDTKYTNYWNSELQKNRAKESSLERSIPHPVINYETCIGCHACILACPHDVLGFDEQEHHAIVVNYEQCMEDTGCQQACPTVPQSCVLINTKKNIAEVPKPSRKSANDGFEAEHVSGMYLIGDVSGVPLIRNAIKEGCIVINKIFEELQTEKIELSEDYYDVVIIGIGPAGIASTARAAELGLKYLALEQGTKYETIVGKYPAGKYVAFNPFNPSDPPLGAIELDGAGDVKENMLALWNEAMDSLNLQINEYEGCKEIIKEEKFFTIKTEKNKNGYKAKKVVLAIGNSGEPRKLKVPGEIEGRVEYRLKDASLYKNKSIIIVGAGNSAVEAAISLVGSKQPDGTVIFSNTDANSITIVIRSDFPKDLTLENKMWIYYCIDRGKIKAYFGAEIKEIRPNQVVLGNVRSKVEITTLQNDIVFAMVGSIAPKEFLTKVGIKYSGNK